MESNNTLLPVIQTEFEATGFVGAAQIELSGEDIINVLGRFRSLDTVESQLG